MRPFLGVVLLATGAVHAEPAPRVLALEDAIAFADAHHPSRRADAAQLHAAAAEIDAARAAYTPDLEVFAELDRSTSNGVPGALFPVPGLPTVTPNGTGFFRDSGHWGTAAGATASWDVLGASKWDAEIDRAKAELQLARAEADTRALDVEYAAGDRFIAAVANDETVAAAKAGVDRAQVFLTIVKATVGSDLRAGADLSRAQAELAFAQTALVRAETARDTSLAALREALGVADAPVELARGHLDAAPPGVTAPPAHEDPRVTAAKDRARVADAERRVIETATLPRLALVGAIWGRGSGELTGDQDIAYGLVPEIPNWSLGVVLSWPLLAYRTVGPRARAQQARADRERALGDELALRLATGGARAKAIVDGALRVAQNTPAALKAARDAEAQITARYKAQLATADDVAQVQRLLVQAETDDAIARLDVWRALLLAAYARGDLAAFLAEYKAAR